MKVIVSEIPDDGLEIELNDRIQAKDLNIVSPVHAALRFDKQEADVIMTGSVEGTVMLQCSRCLADFAAAIAGRTDMVFHPLSTIRETEPGQLKGDELDTAFYQNDCIDTDEILAEQLLLNLPMKPLCSADCKGICPQCGADLSLAECTCERTETDPRLAVLQQLLPKKE